MNELSDAIAIAGIDGDHERLAQLGQDYAEAEAQLDGAYGSWEEINAQLEAITLAASAR